jgi:hypothetical protein
MSRHQRRAQKSQGRADRVKRFRRAAGGGGYETSLCPIGQHRPQDDHAIKNWLLSEPTTKPICFSCRAQFGPARRPAAFLTAVATRAGPTAGIAVSACCSQCWTDLPAERIEEAALSLLRRQLGAQGFADDDT